ncbi:MULTISPECIES: type VI secretion system Vgr family protein [unclassified Pseudomonas]|uniref:type VI secretion system Vgr family protein n=1 Tax=unclassified Pseudomonas TaxID=196821 RepID=UPI002AC94D91|nr:MULTISPECIES: contractile injection system protein, VgrG/Pvc8 family [unclassified Pseudomonas]MEB0046892.1 contractile injection system protein, VgrG/Pvc8 family [Pseudomonas sp. Dout3]MEB0098632.1 contractile injection system protein, VgrG/Pvc8 family [Pseudomonas sp. DC1.2]WPX59598.1 contractile injection system protein, VgrG/Pvc8 family [Pseudomonas sp. DC1.2]
MFDPVNEPSFRLDIAGLPDPFEVLAFTGSEAISEPFLFDVDLLINDLTLDLASLLYRPAFLHFGAAGNGIHGHLYELVQRAHGASAGLCRVRLEPALASLSQRFTQRVFSGRSVPQILSQVLREHGIAGKDRRFELTNDYPPRDFCTQYRESDLQFLQRLCAEERLHYYFEHRLRGHCLVFGDGERAFCLGDALLFQAASKDGDLCRFNVQKRTQTDCLEAQATQIAQVAEGQTGLETLRSGRVMGLSGHPCSEWNALWLLTRVEHQADAGLRPAYHNRIYAVPWGASFLTPFVGAKPDMQSLQRAWVVEVDESPPDPSRPVAVQFDWLYQGEGARPSHCWLSLAPSLCNDGVSPLAAGCEVVVNFIEGDPDQPLITGVFHRMSSLDKPPTCAPLPVSLENEGLGLLGLLRASEPLVLLCLLPGGGSFNHCVQAVCVCRAATQLGQSGVA